MTSRREFTKIISIGSMGTLMLGASSCVGKENKQSGAVVWPSDKLNLAFVGIAGRGGSNLRALKDQNVVALCDVDWRERQQKSFDAFPNAKRYKDFRVMLEKQKDIDAVVISTPDHNHGVIATMAIKMGKHVYCEKPLAHSVFEVREITRLAKEYGVQTQMGNQGHSSESIRQFYEHIKAGTIGKVTEVHAWCDRPAGGGSVSFPHGIARPTGDYKIPRQLNWDIWLGPAQDRPYQPDYLPMKWRGFIDFGCGALGDFGCHTLDPAFWALDLGSPDSVIASTSNLLAEVKYDTFATASIITYKFPQRENQPPVKLTWYDGGLLPLHDDRLRDLKYEDCGALLIGEKGIITHGSHGASDFKILLFDKTQETGTPPQLVERSKGPHADWVEAIKTGKPASANFNYGGPLTETVLLGTAASLYRNQELKWDNNAMRITNLEQANSVIKPEFRAGW
ncbi:MAG: Gfo/Idh/MocA family oxidoreductase [Bacteroidales bacterium]